MKLQNGDMKMFACNIVRLTEGITMWYARSDVFFNRK